MANNPTEMTITIAQAIALAHRWGREYHDNPDKRIPLRDFMAQVSPVFGGDGAITVPWCGMLLCIEKDGYIHS